jgi:hypothetical protein
VGFFTLLTPCLFGGEAKSKTLKVETSKRRGRKGSWTGALRDNERKSGTSDSAKSTNERQWESGNNAEWEEEERRRS